MSKLTDQFLNKMKLTDDDDNEGIFAEDYDDYGDDDLEQEEVEKPKRKFSLFNKKKDIEEEQIKEEPKIEPVMQKTTRVSSQSEARKARASSRKVSNIVSITRGDEVKIIKPQSFIESKTITDYLRANKTVVVNLEGLEITTAQRIIDCIGGASYALGGSLDQISNKIFILAPKDVDISGDLINELTGDSIISPDLGSF